MYYLFFFISVCIACLINGLSYEPRRFGYRLFSEGGTHIKWDESHINYGRDLWLRLNSINNTNEIFWLRLETKSSNHFPVLIQVNAKGADPVQTNTQLNKCLYSAATHFIPYSSFSSVHSPLTTKQLKKEMRLVSTLYKKNEQIEYLIISFCNGISGIVQLHNSTSYVYFHSNQHANEINVQLLSSVTPHPSSVNSDKLKQGLFNAADASFYRRRRMKRSSFHMPVRNMPGPFLVELYIIVDSKMASTFGKYANLIHRVTFIMNQINMAFSQFNIYFTVVQLEIWEDDQIKLTDENHILMELQLYKRRFVTKRHDCLHAILGENLGTSRRGQSELASMCGYNRCVGYTKDYYLQKELEISHSVLHEIGHNFGLHHDTEQCKCYGCIMATGIESGSFTFNWSNCSKNEIKSLLKSGMADCLLDKPPSGLGKLNPIIMEINRASQYIGNFTTSKCGNGVVDDGEQCDCGSRKQCESDLNKCCHSNTCRFKAGASCAGGSCCDLESCSLKKSGTICRAVGSENCDLPEFCNGNSEWCPPDVYKQDGIRCTNSITRESSHCYRGTCSTRKSRCRLLWGNTGEESNRICYNSNSEGNQNLVENCGLEIPREVDRDRQPRNWDTKICSKENEICGRLWCSHDNERVLRLSEQFVKDKMVNEYHCSAVRFDMDWYLDDFGMVPNGVSCGSGKICWKSECVPISNLDLNRCYGHCHGHGDCNSLGNCHCHPGFSPPNCTTSGDGGSIDSGPPPKFHHSARIIISAVLISVIVILTILVILTFIYHYRYHTWPYLVSFIKCPNYKKTQKDHDLKSLSHENQYPKSRRPLVLNVDVKYISKETHSPLYSPKSPKSPDKSLRKPLSVKEKAQFLENPQKKVVQKPKVEKVNSEAKPEIKKKPVNYTNINKPEILTKKPVKILNNEVNVNCSSRKAPPILGLKPQKQLSSETSPPLLGGKPHTTPVSESRPPLLCGKPQKTSVTESEPSKVSTKPQKISIVASGLRNKPKDSYLPDQSGKPGCKTTETKDVLKLVKPLKFQISQPKLDHSSNVQASEKYSPIMEKEKLPSKLYIKPQKTPQNNCLSEEKDSSMNSADMHEIKLARPLKFQISQPRLEQTTCTDATCDLPNVDKTLTRNVAPHKILKCDPSNAVNFYN